MENIDLSTVGLQHFVNSPAQAVIASYKDISQEDRILLSRQWHLSKDNVKKYVKEQHFYYCSVSLFNAHIKPHDTQPWADQFHYAGKYYEVEYIYCTGSYLEDLEEDFAFTVSADYPIKERNVFIILRVGKIKGLYKCLVKLHKIPEYDTHWKDRLFRALPYIA